MTPKAYPIKIDILDHDEAGQPSDVLAQVVMRDEASASVEIKAGVNATEWAVLSAVIGEALRSMEMQGDAR